MTIRIAGRVIPEEVPLTHSDKVSRGIGVADMAYAMQTGRAHRANAGMTFHVLDVMQAFQEASEKGRHVPIKSRCERPAPLPVVCLQGRWTNKIRGCRQRRSLLKKWHSPRCHYFNRLLGEFRLRESGR